MPSSINPDEIRAEVTRIHGLGVDSINLGWDDDNKHDTCTIGWGDLTVKGIGFGPIAALLSAERKIRAAIAEKYPSVELPPGP